jgi:transposase
MPPKKNSKGTPKKRARPEDYVQYTENHDDFFGKGHHHPLALKIALLHVDKGLRGRYPNRSQKTHEKEFQQITNGFSYYTIREYKKELEDNADHLYDPDSRGRKYPKLADKEEYDFLFLWMMEKVEAAKKGGYLTLAIICDALWAEKQLKCSQKEMSEALHTLGFRYKRRRAVYVTKRGEERVQRMLQNHCRWIYERTERLPSGRHVFKTPVCFQDESWTEERAFRLESWVFGEDNAADMGKGAGARIALLDTIFSFKFVASARKAWNCAHKTGKYHGNCTADVMEMYYGDDVFPNLKGNSDSLAGAPGGTALCDNCSTHKAYLENIKDFNRDDLFAFVVEKETDIKKKKEFIDKVQKEWDGLPNRECLKNMRGWIRDSNLRTRNLENLAILYNCQLRYVPPYHPECNPIEYVWCRLKRRYRDLPRDMPWKERLRRAYEGIDQNFIDSCIDRSIRWCLAVHAKFLKVGVVQVRVPPVHVAPAADSEDSS